MINPFLANVPILHPLVRPENLWFSGVTRGYKMGSLVRNGLNRKSIGFKHTIKGTRLASNCD